MALYCLATEPYIDNQFPDNRKWLVITKDYPKPKPENGKKRVSKDKSDGYNNMTNKREKMFKQLKTGHYNCFNQSAEGEDILSYANRIVGENDCIYYRIKPTSCKITSEKYNYSSKNYLISEFDVVSKCETTEQLLLQIEKDHILNDFLAEAFDSGRYPNRQENFKDILQFCKSNAKEHTFCIGEIVAKDNREHNRVPRFGTDDTYIENFAKELISEGLILLHSWSDFYEKQTFTFMIRMHWFDLALDYIKVMEDKNFNPLREVVIEDKNFKDIERILKTNNDKKFVNEIIKMLNYKPSTLTLKVFPYVSEWDDFKEISEPIDIKEFEYIDEVKAYLVTEYKVPFSKLTGDISDFEYSANEYEITHFVVE